MEPSHKQVNSNSAELHSRAHELDDSSDSSVYKPTLLVPDEKGNKKSPSLVFPSPEKLQSLMNFELPTSGLGKSGLIQALEKVLKYSVNTWDQGFMDKLSASTNVVHVFKVSPALTIIEKTTTKTFARFFGFDGPHAGGISTQGGSASNLTSIIVARNNLYPECKTFGYGSKKFAIFTSSEGHYSLERAASICGLGSDNVWLVPVDEYGCMIPSELERCIKSAQAESRIPFYVNATAGTTVFGSYDPFNEISAICKKNNMWMHIDASWGGPVIFSQKHKHKLIGCHLADSLAVNPHKMMAVPVTCSFLLTPDLRKFHKANSFSASYLFHSDNLDKEVWDLADMTLQCGRRADSFKLALSWVYYGKEGFEKQIDQAFSIAAQFATLISENPAFLLLSKNPPPCLQVCFYYLGKSQISNDEKFNTYMTRQITNALLSRGFFVDYASGIHGLFFRVVVNLQTHLSTITDLIKAIEEIGNEIENGNCEA